MKERKKSSNKAVKVKQKFSWNLMWKQRYLLLMSIPFVIWLIIFKYIPLWGWTMGFQEVKPKSFALPIWERKFVGFENFKRAFTDRLFGQTMVNTICLSIIGLALGTFLAILFALMLNEICFTRFKKVTQTVSYLPHFVSWVVIASIAKMLLNDGGTIDTLLGKNLHLMS
ncbi:MAG: sugar ABC transporter permease, partial [Roseburia sp.]|nr:sugar ABC transporter permease [Roseburia sp.]